MGLRSHLRQAVTLAIGLAVGFGAAVVTHEVTSHPETRVAARSRSRTVVVLDAPRRAGRAVAGLPAATVVEVGSARAAVASFLGAEALGQQELAYGLLAASDQQRFATPAGWIAKQADRLQPVTFVVGDGAPDGGIAGAVDVRVAVTHRPSLDPFAGLMPARTDQVLRVQPEAGGWRVVADPIRIDPVYPSDAVAPAVVRDWIARLARCDRGAASRLEATDATVGSPYYADRPCREPGRWTVGDVGPATGADVQPLVAAFGPDVSTWGRLVPVRGPTTKFFAAVAPIGDTWRVMGVLDDQRGSNP